MSNDISAMAMLQSWKTTDLYHKAVPPVRVWVGCFKSALATWEHHITLEGGQIGHELRDILYPLTH